MEVRKKIPGDAVYFFNKASEKIENKNIFENRLTYTEYGAIIYLPGELTGIRISEDLDERT